MRSRQDHFGRLRTITDRIAKTEGVKTTHSVTGMFDLIAFVEASDIDNLIGTARTKTQTT